MKRSRKLIAGRAVQTYASDHGRESDRLVVKVVTFSDFARGGYL